jgi:uncharacterized protein (TIGR02246 family)
MTASAYEANQAADIAAIKKVFERLVEYWNRGDGRAYGTLFTEDADYIDITGTRTQGGEAIGRHHQFLFDGPLKGSQLQAGSATSPEVKFLAPDVALVISGGASRLEGQTEAPNDRQSINTNVLVKRGGQWRIRAFQNNRITPFPRPPMSGQPG